MKDWNVVVSVYQKGFRPAVRALEKLGPTERSPYHNVLLMRVDDPIALLDALDRRIEQSPPLYDAIARAAPAMRSFDFATGAEFRERAEAIVREWSPRLAGRTFHARLHRRGAHEALKTPELERFLDDTVLAATAAAGAPARLCFKDPDAVVVADTVDNRAGMALWTREDLARHRLLRPD